MSTYPDCFPLDFENRILPKDALAQDIEVYRVCENGEIEPNSFLSTYEEALLGTYYKTISELLNELDEDDPILYSTSCFTNFKKVVWIVRSKRQNGYPNPIIVKGYIKGIYGLSQVTYERTKHDKKSGHIDWWIYKDANKQLYNDGWEKVDLNEKANI